MLAMQEAFDYIESAADAATSTPTPTDETAAELQSAYVCCGEACITMGDAKSHMNNVAKAIQS